MPSLCDDILNDDDDDKPAVMPASISVAPATLPPVSPGGTAAGSRQPTLRQMVGLEGWLGLEEAWGAPQTLAAPAVHACAPRDAPPASTETSAPSMGRRSMPMPEGSSAAREVEKAEEEEESRGPSALEAILQRASKSRLDSVAIQSGGVSRSADSSFRGGGRNRRAGHTDSTGRRPLATADSADVGSRARPTLAISRPTRDGALPKRVHFAEHAAEEEDDDVPMGEEEGEEGEIEDEIEEVEEEELAQGVEEWPKLTCEPRHPHVDFPLGPRPRHRPTSIYPPTAQIAANLNRHLRSYQREGVEWMWRQYAADRGGVLGDEMGLGKTVQVAALLSAIMGKSGTATDKDRTFPLPEGDARIALVVVPTTTVANWERELATWGYFKVQRAHGSTRSDALAAARERRCEVVLTTYGMLRGHIEDFRSISWEVLSAPRPSLS